MWGGVQPKAPLSRPGGRRSLLRESLMRQAGMTGVAIFVMALVARGVLNAMVGSFTIPNVDDPTSERKRLQGMPDSGDFVTLVKALAQTGVVSGCQVTEDASPGMEVAVSEGEVVIEGESYDIAPAVVPLVAAHVTNPRFDLIVAEPTGVDVITGLAASPAAAPGPVFPLVPDEAVLLAAVFVPAGETAILSANIVDKRVMLLNDHVKTAGAQIIAGIKTWVDDAWFKKGPVFDIRAYGAVAEGIAGPDAGPATREAVAAAAARGGGRVYIPPTPLGFLFTTGVPLPSGVSVFGDGYGSLIHHHATIAGVGNHLFRIEDATGVRVRNLRVKAGSGVRVGVAMAGVTRKVRLEGLDLEDHLGYAIQYADTDTNPATAYFDNVRLKDIDISGECTPGDGAGIIFFCRAVMTTLVRGTGDGSMTSGTKVLDAATGAFTSADVGRRVTIAGAGVAGATLTTSIAVVTSPTSVIVNHAASTTVAAAAVTISDMASPAGRLMLKNISVDVSRGFTDSAQHGNECLKLQAATKVVGSGLVLRGGLTGCLTLSNGLPDVNLSNVTMSRANIGLNMLSSVSDTNGRVENVNIDNVIYLADGVTGTSRYGFLLGHPRRTKITNFYTDLPIRFADQGAQWTIEGLTLAHGTASRMEIENPASPLPDIVSCLFEDIEFIGGPGTGGGRAHFDAANRKVSSSTFKNLRFREHDGHALRVNGNDNYFEDIKSINGNPDNDATISVIFDDGLRNHVKKVTVVGASGTEQHVDYFYRRVVDGEFTLNGPLIGTVSDEDGISLASQTSRCHGDLVVKSAKVDLSGAQTDEVVFVADQDYYILAIQHYYSEASSSDAGVNVRVGTPASVSAYHVAASGASQAVGSSTWFVNDGASPAIAGRDVPAGTGINIRNTGGKVGTGEVIVTVTLVKAGF